MSVIKGQNLRIIIGGQCVAAATSCTLHLAAQVEDSSTKDSDGDWAEQEVTGFSWDASVEALVVDTEYSAGTASIAQQLPNPPQDTYGIRYTHALPTPFTLKKGQSVKITIPASTDLAILAGTPAGADGMPGTTLEIVTHAYGLHLAYTAERDMTVWLAAANQTTVTYSVEQEPDTPCIRRLQQAMEAREPVDVKMSLTGGFNNRFEEKKLLEGKALISDFQQNAANRQNGTYTAQLTGTGPLAPAASRATAMLSPVDGFTRVAESEYTPDTESEDGED